LSNLRYAYLTSVIGGAPPAPLLQPISEGLKVELAEEAVVSKSIMKFRRLNCEDGGGEDSQDLGKS